MIDTHQFCFILCTNDKTYEAECMKYMNDIEIPEGYTVDILSVYDAESMTAGYNEAMQASNAKYKIYLHQDVFIINKHILSDILKIFEDKDIGMIGMIGSVKLPDTSIMWDGPRIGKIYCNNMISSMCLDFEKDEKSEQREVMCIDGLMMITQYDIAWREDLFKHWDFYDVSQSFEFIRAGYKVVVPQIEKPWCLHDDHMLNLTNYYNEREIFVREYIY